MKRRIACLLICVCLLLCMALPAGAQDEGAAFTDRGRIRNVGAVQMLVDLGLISGYDDGTFPPGQFYHARRGREAGCHFVYGKPAGAGRRLFL